MSLDQINNQLLSSGGPTIKLNALAVGEIVKATIVDAEYRPKTDVVTGEPLTFPDGRPKTQLVLNVQRDGVDEEERIFLHWTAEKSLADVLRRKGLKLERGGTVAIQRLDDKPAERKGMSPTQQYACDYAAPPIAQPSAASLL